MNNDRKRRWFQFSLRAMLVVMTMASAGLGWLAYERNEVRRHEDAVAAIRKLGGAVRFYKAKAFRPAWLRFLLGETLPGQGMVVDFYETKVTDTDLAILARVPELKQLWLSRTQVTDAGLVHLAGLPELDLLYLSETQVSDQGVSQLEKALPNIEIVR